MQITYKHLQMWCLNSSNPGNTLRLRLMCRRITGKCSHKMKYNNDSIFAIYRSILYLSYDMMYNIHVYWHIDALQGTQSCPKQLPRYLDHGLLNN